MNAVNDVFNSLESDAIPTTFTSNLNQFFRVTPTFSLLHINIRSINKNFNQFILWFQGQAVSPDVIVLTEAWLDALDGSVYHVPGYTTEYVPAVQCRNDGVVMFIKNSFSYKISAPHIPFCNSTLLTVTCSSFCFNILAIYRSPSQSNAQTQDFIVNLQDFCETRLTSSGCTGIVVGDINIDLLDKLNNDTELYLESLSTCGLNSVINLPTRIDPGSQRNSCLDHIFINKISGIKGYVLDTAITDHFPVVMTWHSDDIHGASGATRTRERLSKRIDYDAVAADLLTFDWSLLLISQDPNFIADNFTQILQSTIISHTTLNVTRNKDTLIKPWLTLSLLKCIRRRDRLAKQCRMQPFNTSLLQYFKDYKNRLTSTLRASKDDYYRNRFVKFQGNLKKTWQTISDVGSDLKKKSDEQDIMLSRVDGPTTDDPAEVADIFNDYFSTIGSKLASKIPNNFAPTQQKVNNHIFILEPTNEDEVSQLIQSLKSDSANGPDDIPAKLLKHISPLILKPLTHLINVCFRTGTFPSIFKTAYTIVIFKEGDKTNPGNYRPISLISQLSKILEKSLKSRLLSFLESTKHFSNRQYGFRPGRSTQDAMYALIESISTNLNPALKKKVLAIFLDLAKAFDTVQHAILLRKVDNAGIIGKSFALLKSYLSGRVQRVKIGSSLSEPRPVVCGVPQGTVLGPLLFLLYINDLLEMDSGGELTGFADDTGVVFSADSWEELNEEATRGLSSIKNWLVEHKLTLNVSKTKLITFALSKASQPPDLQIRIHDNCQTVPCSCQVIERVGSVRYLGVHIDDILKWDVHITATVKRLRRTYYLFYRLRRILSLQTLRSIYYALTQSIITYGILMWGGSYNKYINKVSVAQRSIIKIIYFKDRLYPTDLLYNESKITTVHRLYMEQLGLKAHKHNFFNPLPHHEHGTRGRSLLRLPAVWADTLRRQAPYLTIKISSHIPNDLKQLTKTFKTKLKAWLATLEHSSTITMLHTH